MIRRLIPVVAAILVVISCRPVESQGVQSYLEGKITVSAEVDSVAEYAGFEVIVFRDEVDGSIDTLGHAITAADGSFSMVVNAATRGVYPVYLHRRGTRLGVGELVVANGDSAVLEARLPLANGKLRIRSPEIAAWNAYRNIRAQHNQSLYELAASQENTQEKMLQVVKQTCNILWGLDETFSPDAVGVLLAKVEAVVLSSGWDDSLSVAKARQIKSSNPGFVEMVRAARRAEGRLRGTDSAIAMISEFQAGTTIETQIASLEAEKIQAYIDDSREEEALEVIASMRNQFDSGDWDEWLRRAEYEIRNLLPGSEAPAFSILTSAGKIVDLSSLRDTLIVLEFWDPRSEEFQQDVAQLEAVSPVLADLPIAWFSISVAPNRGLTDAFLEGRNLPGTLVYEPEGPRSRLVTTYNVNVIPTRYLIDGNGKIVGKYAGNAFGTLIQDINGLLARRQNTGGNE